ncbi:hypothetical protein CAP31_03755 [Sulfuriferula sp. AH1]|uniref:hypothetical protein n=1 Tax=Sulfuriferula sp. AH1 TaxID=1985873 RepID=UPI000B3B1DFA|nr:hypothetical protein [Sulfuriferula sp. AH1]ARU30877.1 hypothetical protein CAP31_03755 [Sulfuriferula sp. AH1]
MSTTNNVIIVRVTFGVVIPNGQATEKEITDWLRFYLDGSGSLSNANPFADQEPEGVPGMFKWDVVCAGVRDRKGITK